MFKFKTNNIYQAAYYLKGHPEKTTYELFFANSNQSALNHVQEMNDSGKIVFELNKQILAFETIKKWDND